MTARINISSNWKKPKVPMTILKTRIIQIATNEKLRYVLQNDMETFEKIWLPWLMYENDCLPQLALHV